MLAQDFTPKTFRSVTKVQGDWDKHIADQKSWLYEGMCHFDACAREFASQIEELSVFLSQTNGEELENLKAHIARLEKSRQFCYGMARQNEEGWHRVDRGQNPFAHAGKPALEEQQESQCSGQGCELKEAGIDLAEIDAKKVLI